MHSAIDTPPPRRLRSRILRGSAVTILGFGGTQVLRLAGNLVLTRLLMPEAFGLMTLITVLLVGLKLFSDVGISQSIMRSPRGDDPVFLDSAWTLDVIRGLLLWLVASLIAWPMAQFYGVDGLSAMVVVAASSLAVAGFEPSRVDSALRHLQLGRVTLYDLASQILATLIMIVLAWATGSVWSLVIGQVIGALIRLAMMSFGLPGQLNRFRLERDAVHELISFGKWVFVSTIAGFIVMQGDKLILSTFLSLDMLGIYNIGYTLAAVPLMIGGSLVGRLMIPLYREHPPADSVENFRTLRHYRFMLSLGLLAMSAVLALAGGWLIGFMYDPRYQAAGAVVVLLSVSFMPQIVTMSYDQIALSVGDSRRFFLLIAARGILFLICTGAGAALYGLVGVIMGQGLSFLLSCPLIARLARRYGAWDPLHDMVMGALFLAVACAALFLNRDFIMLLS